MSLIIIHTRCDFTSTINALSPKTPNSPNLLNCLQQRSHQHQQHNAISIFFIHIEKIYTIDQSYTDPVPTAQTQIALPPFDFPIFRAKCFHFLSFPTRISILSIVTLVDRQTHLRIPSDHVNTFCQRKLDDSFRHFSCRIVIIIDSSQNMCDFGSNIV